LCGFTRLYPIAWHKVLVQTIAAFNNYAQFQLGVNFYEKGGIAKK